MPESQSGESTNSAETLTTWINQTREFVRTLFLYRGELAPPIVFLLVMIDTDTGREFEDGPRTVVIHPDESYFASPKSKDAFVARLRQQVVESKAIAVVLAFEAWMVSAPIGTPRSAFPQDLSTDPLREECLYYTVETPDKCEGRSAKIRRDESGKPSLDDWSSFQGTHGRFVRLLPPIWQ
jgi:hypothetical protein